MLPSIKKKNPWLFVFSVTIPPIITTHPPKDIFFKENESIEMPCVASGEPEPTLV